MPFKPGRLCYATRNLPGVEAGKAYEFLGCMAEGRMSVRDASGVVTEIDEEEFMRSFTPQGSSKIKVESVLSTVGALRPVISRKYRRRVAVPNRVQRVMRRPAAVESVLQRVRAQLTERSR